MTRSRLLFLLLVAALLAAFVAPAGAATDPRAQRDAARAKKAKLAAQLNALKASETELLSAAAALDDQVLAQAARVAASRQAAAAATAELNDINGRLQETRQTIDHLTTTLVDRAVQAYMAPQRQDLTQMQDPTDMAESARRAALMESVSANDQSLLDQLRAAREDAEIEQQAAEAARARALQRTKDTSSRLRELEVTRSAKKRLAQAITTRQREVLSEIDEQAKADADLSRIIAERERKSGGFVPGAGSNARSGGCIWPASGTVTSEYGTRWGRLHAGIDIAGPIGSPIWAAKAGEVIFAGQQSGYGNVIMIDHGGGLVTLYGHLSRIGVSDGQTVSQGQTIGARGNTGHSTGPHLHFETRYGGSPRDPRGCLS
jgi:murein DD-endopeptidase MepM/ murein hydrolase activator NlpD